MRRSAVKVAALAVALTCSACGASAPLAVAPGSTTEPGFEAGIEQAYLTQGVQDLDGAVPLLAGRPGLLRVFLRAMSLGVAAPVVRARLVDTASGVTILAYRPTSPLRDLPTGIFEGARGGSWNAFVPGEDVLPGRHLVVEMEQAVGIPGELQRTTFRVPPAGSLDVRLAPVPQITVVPIVQSGLAPDVTGSRTLESWFDLARVAFPVGGLDAVVAPTMTTDLRLTPGGAGWSELLDELELRRLADGSSRIYLGVVRVATASGTVGRARAGGGCVLVADVEGHYPRIAAHELGHALGLGHAPCGTDDLDSLDPEWPLDLRYADAHTGVFGWDPRSGAILDPARTYDLMSYCGGPADTWISDFGYLKVLATLAPAGPPVAGEAP